MGYVTDLDTPLLKLSDRDGWTSRQGCGGLVTAVKQKEVELWKRYAEEHGRKDSLILFDQTDGSSTHLIDREPAQEKEKGPDVDLDR